MEITKIDNSKFKTVSVKDYTFSVIEENLIKKTITIQKTPTVFSSALSSLVITEIKQPSNEAIVLRRAYE